MRRALRVERERFAAVDRAAPCAQVARARRLPAVEIWPQIGAKTRQAPVAKAEREKHLGLGGGPP